MKPADIYFYERQRMNQWWKWLVLIGVNVLFLTGIFRQMVLKIPFGNNPMNDSGLIITLIISILFSFLMLSGSLQTYINKEGVFVKFTPFRFRYKFYDWNAIHAVHIRKCNPIKEFGGWGIRIGIRKITDKAYIVSGNMALELFFKDGRKVLIGTKQSDYLKVILMKLDKMEHVKNGDKEREND